MLSCRRPPPAARRPPPAARSPPPEVRFDFFVRHPGPATRPPSCNEHPLVDLGATARVTFASLERPCILEG